MIVIGGLTVLAVIAVVVSTLLSRRPGRQSRLDRQLRLGDLEQGIGRAENDHHDQDHGGTA